MKKNKLSQSVGTGAGKSFILTREHAAAMKKAERAARTLVAAAKTMATPCLEINTGAYSVLVKKYLKTKTSSKRWTKL